MKAQKRGLGRGLEVLLAEPSETQKLSPTSGAARANGLDREAYLALMDEAVNLKILLDELAGLLGKNGAR